MVVDCRLEVVPAATLSKQRGKNCGTGTTGYDTRNHPVDRSNNMVQLDSMSTPRQHGQTVRTDSRNQK
jgi:hypothetical protein